MAQVEKSVLVAYSAEKMFALVDGVEDYPVFLPWCGGSEVKWRDESSTVGTVHISYMGIKQSFTTENSKQYPTLIEMRLQEGPFKQLEGNWSFTPLNDEACKVAFFLRYEFSSKLLEGVLSPVFDHITGTFVDAFVKRAEQVYGE